MANIRHVVVIRKDLNMSAGLMAAQVAHASDKFMREKIISAHDRDEIERIFSSEELEWMKSPYISVLGVDSLDELNYIHTEAQIAGLEVFEWTDLIPFKNLQKSLANVKVAISIGPADFDKIKAVTGNLPLA